MQNLNNWARHGLLPALLMVTACSPNGPMENYEELNVSSPTQITVDDHPCKEWDQRRIDYVMGRLPQNFIREYSGERLTRVQHNLAGIPDKYIDWLIELNDRNGFYIADRNPGFTGGVTQISQSEAFYIHIYPSARVVDLTLQHEVGHAVHPYMRTRRDTGFDRTLGGIANGERQNSNLNRYPKTYPEGSAIYHTEFWGEAFNSYYCSEDTNDMVKTQFPATYNFMREYAEPPVWESTQEPGDDLGNDLFLAVKSESAGGDLRLAGAGPQQVKSFGLCTGSYEECIESRRIDLGFTVDVVAGSPRSRFTSEGAFAPSRGSNHVLLGFDASSALIMARPIRMDSAQ